MPIFFTRNVTYVSEDHDKKKSFNIILRGILPQSNIDNF